MLDADNELTGQKSELLNRLDVEGMDRVVAICHYGRSGSLLLASFLDGHPDLITLPMLCGAPIYDYYVSQGGLSVWDKLLAYPAFSGLMETRTGEFRLRPEAAVDERNFTAAVCALKVKYSSRDASWLNSRATFFRLVHVAYALAANKPSGIANPIMVFPMHFTDDVLARELTADFPGTKFVHTIRDPISAIDSWFDRQVALDVRARDAEDYCGPQEFDAAAATYMSMLGWDAPHHGMGDRSCAVRFEDMHVRTEGLMRELSSWLGIPFSSALLCSTWNGVPYEVEANGKLICGASPANAIRRAKNLSKADCWLIFALLQRNFTKWKYAIPGLFGSRVRCALVLLLLLPVPSRLEVLNAKINIRRAARMAKAPTPSRFLRVLAFSIIRRMRIMVLVGSDGWARWRGRRDILQLLEVP